jgi:hypothetical protein
VHNVLKVKRLRASNAGDYPEDRNV